MFDKLIDLCCKIIKWNEKKTRKRKMNVGK